MIGAEFIQIALVATSATIALVLIIAWREFGRPRHVFTWALAFALLALAWSIGLLPVAVPYQHRIAIFLEYALAGAASVLDALGFRQRAGTPHARRPLRSILLLYLAAVLGLTLADAARTAQMVPINVLNVVMFYLSARTLRGRRKGERVAERVAESGLLLLAVASAAVAIGLIAALAGVIRLDIGQLQIAIMLLLPGIVAGTGLFTIILLAADLADQARRLAASDMMTGLLNRRGFEDAGKALIDSAQRNHRALTLALMDVDCFKQVNDRFGHPTGDRVLCAIADRLAASLGRRDILARIGGEEFAVVLVDADVVTATMTVEAMRRDLAALDLRLTPPHQVTGSFGVAALHADDDDLAHLLRRADAALYRSKENGRDRVTVA